ncbi:CSLREA domain-containing protein [Geodermatophilus sp. SYSU D00758]
MRTRRLAGAALSAVALGLVTAGPALAEDHGPRGGGDRSHGEGWRSGDGDRGDRRDRGDGDRLRVTTAADTVDAAPGDGRCADMDGACSLRAAVQEANALGGGTIEPAEGTYALSLAGTGEDAAATGDLDVTGRLTLRGGGATVDARGLDRVFDVRPGAWLHLEAVTVTGGAARGTGLPASGGGLLNAGTLHLERSTVTGNTAVRAGGGIEASAGSTTTVSRSTLSRNATGAGPGNGGGLHLTGAGTVTVERSTVTGNAAAAEGGGLWNSEPGTMTVTRTGIRGNRAPVGPDVFQDGNGTGFTADGRTVPANGS